MIGVFHDLKAKNTLGLARHYEVGTALADEQTEAKHDVYERWGDICVLIDQWRRLENWKSLVLSKVYDGPRKEFGGLDT